MQKLQVFKSTEFGELSVLLIDGKEYFPATECATKLGYTNPHDAISRHCRALVKREVIDSLGRAQEMNFMPEGDLYRLIVRSKLPAAERFERWVFDEILPTVRKTGTYSIQPMTELQILRGAIDQIEVAQRMALEAKEEAAQANQQIQAVKEAIIQTDRDWRRWINKQMQRIGFKLGDYQGIKNESYDLLEQRGRCNLERRLENLKTRMREAGATRTQVANANYLDVIETEPRLKEIYSAIVRELTVKYVA